MHQLRQDVRHYGLLQFLGNRGLFRGRTTTCGLVAQLGLLGLILLILVLLVVRVLAIVIAIRISILTEDRCRGLTKMDTQKRVVGGLTQSGACNNKIRD